MSPCFTHFLEAKRKGTWLTEAMEEAIQECQTLGIRIAHKFYDAKRQVEERETAEFNQRYHRTRL